ncbi:MAG: hypothetical protein U0Z53_31445 [Blastocatellia bacterium]
MRRLAEFDRYATLTRENIYRAFDQLDARCREFEMARTRYEKPVSQGESSDRFSVPQPAIMKATAAGRMSPFFQQQVSISAAELRVERIDLPSKETIAPALSGYVQSDREWQFDSLREILTVELSRMPGADREPEIERPPQPGNMIRGR